MFRFTQFRLFWLPFIFAAKIVFGGLRLNEIMGNPAGADYYDEFIEVVNTESTTVDLNGWRLEIDGEEDSLLLAAGSPLLPAGGLALIMDSGYTEHSRRYEDIIPPGVTRFVTEDGALGRNGIPNSRSVLVSIRDGNGFLLDEALWQPQCAEDYSREFCGPQAPPDSSWRCSLQEGGTPGLRNSVAPQSRHLQMWVSGGEQEAELHLYNDGLLSLNNLRCLCRFLYGTREVGRENWVVTALDPGAETIHEVETPLQGGLVTLALEARDGESVVSLQREVCWPGPLKLAFNEFLAVPASGPEWLEILNTDPTLYLNIQNCTFRERGGRPSLLSPRPLLLPPGGMLVLCTDTVELREWWPGQYPRCLPSASFTLNNREEGLALYGPHGSRLDTLSYTEEWFLERGYSQEKFNPRFPNEAQYWSRCLAPERGTPGEVNSIHWDGESPGPGNRISGSVLSPDGDGLHEFITISPRADEWRFHLRVRIFDIFGNCRRTLTEGSQGAAGMTLVWDGSDGKGGLLPPGVYIVLVETRTLAGGTINSSRHPVALVY